MFVCGQILSIFFSKWSKFFLTVDLSIGWKVTRNFDCVCCRIQMV